MKLRMFYESVAPILRRQDAIDRVGKRTLVVGQHWARRLKGDWSGKREIRGYGKRPRGRKVERLGDASESVACSEIYLM